MSRIKLLSETVASQVAAGEVVERPASVVKELVENCIDAGARKIDVSFGGGDVAAFASSTTAAAWIGMMPCSRSSVMPPARFARRKISGDRTLGFRGEALPSIASVPPFA